MSVSFYNPIIQLVDEHKLIQKFTTLFLKNIEQLKDSNFVHPEKLQWLLGFFDYFVNGLHHTKETNILFKELDKNGYLSSSTSINSIIEKQKEGQSLLISLKKLIKEKITPNIMDQFSSSSHEYVALLNRQIDEENQNLFPVALDLLSTEDLNKMSIEFEQLSKMILIENNKPPVDYRELNKELNVINLVQPFGKKKVS